MLSFSLKFAGIFFLFVFIFSWYIVAASPIILSKYFPFSHLHAAGFQIKFLSKIHCFFSHFYTYIDIYYYLFELHFPPSNLPLHSHDICFVNVSNSFFLLIMRKTLPFKSSVLFGSHTLLRVLQLPTHPSKITANW